MGIEGIRRREIDETREKRKKDNKSNSSDNGVLKPDMDFIMGNSRRSLLEQNRGKGNSFGSFREMVELITELAESINDMQDNPDVLDSQIDDTPATSTGGDDALLNDLNQIFTPILIMQGFEGDVGSKIQEAFSESSSLLLEKNIIQFDNATRMAQLISVCALLIARQKNSQKYQMYEQATKVARSMKLAIQKEEYSAAQALAQKFLVKVSTTNNSSVVRQAANELLPETQH